MGGDEQVKWHVLFLFGDQVTVSQRFEKLINRSRIIVSTILIVRFVSTLRIKTSSRRLHDLLSSACFFALFRSALDNVEELGKFDHLTAIFVDCDDQLLDLGAVFDQA